MPTVPSAAAVAAPAALSVAPPAGVPAAAPYDLAPTVWILTIGAAVAVGIAAWAWRRAGRVDDPGRRAAARGRSLAWLTLWLTFDLVLFGAFTRLTDSGLGCPDWPGCYAAATPFGARAAIDAAAAAAPSGPVTPTKAWIEMIHRYLATGVGGLLLAATCMAWWARSRRTTGADTVSPFWPTAALAWVGVQGAFGAWTVTWKLYPAVVTAHLLGGLALLALLAAQVEAGRVDRERVALAVSRSLRVAAQLLAAASIVQLALGGWVSTNAAVLACADFPACQGSLWPTMDFAAGFEPLRELGRRADGSGLPFAALTAIHYVHRLGAYLVLAGMAALAIALNNGAGRARRRWAQAFAAIALWQFATGMSNVLLEAPLATALAHTAGAAGWVLAITTFLMRSRPADGRVETLPRRAAGSGGGGVRLPRRAAP